MKVDTVAGTDAPRRGLTPPANRDEILTAGELVESVVERSGFTRQTCVTVVGSLLAALQHENHDAARRVFASVPGASDLAGAFPVSKTELSDGLVGCLLRRIDGRRDLAEPESVSADGTTVSHVRSATAPFVAHVNGICGAAALSGMLEH